LFDAVLGRMRKRELWRAVDLMTAVNGLWWCLTEPSEVGDSPTSELCNQVKCSCTAPGNLHDRWMQLDDSCVEAALRFRGLR
jgi:hypothetical protein